MLCPNGAGGVVWNLQAFAPCLRSTACACSGAHSVLMWHIAASMSDATAAPLARSLSFRRVRARCSAAPHSAPLMSPTASSRTFG